MPSTKLGLVILAGGLGSRFGGAKQIAPFGEHGRFLFEYACYDAMKAGFEKVFVITRLEMQDGIKAQLQKWIHPNRFEILLQEQNRPKPWGTAHALHFLKGHWSGSFLVLNADDYYGAALFSQVKNLQEKGIRAACLAYPLGETLSSFGAVSRGICELNEDLLSKITEKTKLKLVEGSILDEFGMSYSRDTLISMNAWLLPADFLNFLQSYVAAFLTENADDAQQEIYLPNAVQKAIDSKVLEVQVIKSGGNWFGLTYPEDLQIALKEIEQLECVYYPKQFEEWI
ncbi:MAG: NDP-sugar synthase [Flavobacteriales bacterium]